MGSELFTPNLQQYIKPGVQRADTPQPFPVALQMHEVALEDIFQVTISFT